MNSTASSMLGVVKGEPGPTETTRTHVDGDDDVFIEANGRDTPSLHFRTGVRVHANFGTEPTYMDLYRDPSFPDETIEHFSS